MSTASRDACLASETRGQIHGPAGLPEATGGGEIRVAPAALDVQRHGPAEGHLGPGREVVVGLTFFLLLLLLPDSTVEAEDQPIAGLEFHIDPRPELDVPPRVAIAIDQLQVSLEMSHLERQAESRATLGEKEPSERGRARRGAVVVGVVAQSLIDVKSRLGAES